MSDSLVGQSAPDFELPATGGQTIRLAELKGQNVVLYFYPKDSTPGCTTEGQDFRDHLDAFTATNSVVFGISKDSLKRHENFKAKQSFNFELLSDETSNTCESYKTYKLKKLYGREYMGIERSTFLINTDGIIVKEWRKVKVKGHVEDVLAAAKAL